MRKVISILVVCTMLAIVLSAFRSAKSYDPNTPVAEVLQDMGEPKRDHFVADRSADQVKMGHELIHYGKLNSKFKQRSKSISKFYVCTSCHNTVQEDPVITVQDPEARLEYATKNNIPFLQGSTFWGMVNRDTWYNDDYVKKYGSLVYAANKSLVESMQLCATECSQGRTLKDWEMNAMLAYLWSLELHLSDLDLSEQELARLNTGAESNEEKLQWLRTKYPTRSPATFVEPPGDREKGYAYEGDPAYGEALFRQSCQQCHNVDGESDVLLTDDKLTMKWLLGNKGEYTPISFYEAIRRGTYPKAGHRPYMPLYPAEKMSDKQVEDLRAYMESVVER